jgi:hypothetical protein
VCQAPRAVGDDCAQSSDLGAFNRCAGNLQCVPSGVDTGTPTGYDCQEPGAEGDFCLPRYPSTCQFPLFCNPQDFVCEQPADEAEPCNMLLPLDSCQPGFFCECTANCTALNYEAVGECFPQVADNAACTQSIGCLSGNCENGTTCAPNALCL